MDASKIEALACTDYIITMQRHERETLITSVMVGADDFWTDHRLLISKLRLSIKYVTRNRL